MLVWIIDMSCAKQSEEPCSVVPWWPHTAYGRNLSGVYTDLPMSRGTQCLFRGPTRNRQSMITELSFLGQTVQSLWPFHNSLEIRSTNLICWLIDFQRTCDLCCYYILWLRSQTWIGSQEAPSPPRHGKFWKLDGAVAPRASLRLKVTQIGTAMDFFSCGNAGS